MGTSIRDVDTIEQIYGEVRTQDKLKHWLMSDKNTSLSQKMVPRLELGASGVPSYCFARSGIG